MAELAMLADIQRTVYQEVTRQLHVMAQARVSSSVKDWESSLVPNQRLKSFPL